MGIGLSDKIRAMAQANYVHPAITSGQDHFSIRVRDVITALQAEGYPPSYTPQICSALQTRKFLSDNALEIEDVEGPAKKVSPTVVIKYRIKNPKQGSGTPRHTKSQEEDPSKRAFRLTEKIRGILKEELAAYGGGEAFIRWIRSDDEDAA